MDLKIIYEDNDVLVMDKPAGIVVFPEVKTKENTLIDLLIEKFPKLAGVGDPPRYGVVHRLDKDTSGVLLMAKNNETLIFLQKQFKNREAEKKYIALAVGSIKGDGGNIIETLIGRTPKDKRKQRAYPMVEKKRGRRVAISSFRVLQRFNNYTLLEVTPKTGRKHQIRCHLAYIHHPIAGDKIYGFKDSPTPEGLKRQFLHASYLKIKLPNGEIKGFNSELPEELKIIIKNLRPA